MARKKKPESELSPQLASVKIGKAEHARLKIVSSVEGRDIAEILTEMVRTTLDKRYRAALAKLNEGDGGKA